MLRTWFVAQDWVCPVLVLHAAPANRFVRENVPHIRSVCPANDRIAIHVIWESRDIAWPNWAFDISMPSLRCIHCTWVVICKYSPSPRTPIWLAVPHWPWPQSRTDRWAPDRAPEDVWFVPNIDSHRSQRLGKTSTYSNRCTIPLLWQPPIGASCVWNDPADAECKFVPQLATHSEWYCIDRNCWKMWLTCATVRSTNDRWWWFLAAEMYRMESISEDTGDADVLEYFGFWRIKFGSFEFVIDWKTGRNQCQTKLFVPCGACDMHCHRFAQTMQNR